MLHGFPRHRLNFPPFDLLIPTPQGFANLIADGLSMGMGEYLSAKSEHDYIAAERDREEWEFDNYPEGEVKEMIDLYKERGFSEEDASNVMHIMKNNRKFFIDHMMVQELGLMPPGEDESPLKQGAVMFCAFFVFGLVPLLCTSPEDERWIDAMRNSSRRRVACVTLPLCATP